MIEELKAAEKTQMQPRRGQSLWGAVSLIGVGAYFLLQNMGVLPEANWRVLLNLWPIFLILAGVNIIVSQAPRPVGTMLSGLVSLSTISLVGLLLFGTDLLPELIPALEPPPLKEESVAFALDGAETAQVTLDLSAYPVTLNALQDSNDLLAGTVLTPGRVVLDTDHTDDKITISLDTEHNFSIINPITTEASNGWVLGLNPRVPLDLNIDAGSGSADLNLSQLILTELTLDLGSGRTNLRLPSGSYSAELDGGSGGMDVWLPREGQVSLVVDQGSGGITFYLPAGATAQFIIEHGSGSLQLDERFSLVSGDRGDDQVWETANYEEDGQGIMVELDKGSGRVTVEEAE